MPQPRTDHVDAAAAPHDEGYLDVGDGHLIYWEVHGVRGGKPAVVLHGGPGSGASPGWRDLFDLTTYRVVTFDQRGSGRSRPHASTPAVDLSTNTTHHLVKDIERLRQHLGVERWLVLGGSWGSTLALAYAEAHPESVSQMVLSSVVTTTHREVRWVTRDVGRFFPDEWARFRDGVTPPERDGDLTAAYHRLLMSPNPNVHEPAARRWCRWEDAHVRTHQDDPPDPRYEDPAFRLCFARLVTHYWTHAAWLADEALLRGANRLADIPAVLIHGRRDVSSPLDVPWQLAQAWEGSELVVVEHEGHRGGAATAAALVSATQRFAALG
ncbi:prolyl aminopeptidase [Patulibacter americanus]|uniref:prolyl aminopeptidase n=1 Tax=Patulibacter americanus TaxID=588672 RepID=UPI0003B79740|nr:prolyl aminopeptidase [Patulibacter americanus]